MTNTQNSGTDGKTVAIISHITIIGWIIAIILNGNNKTEIGSFYIRQMLGLVLCGFLGLIPFLGILVVLVLLVLWVISLVNAVNGKMEPLPVVGHLFQQWFRGL